LEKESAEDAVVDSPLFESVEWFLDHLKVERGASAHTVLAYATDLRHAMSYLIGVGIRDWTAIDAPVLIAYESTLGPPLARATALRRISGLRSFLKFLKRNAAGPKADLPSTGGFKKPPRLPKALGEAQIKGLLAAPNLEKPSGIRDRALMELIYGAGVRISEAVSLSCAEVLLEERIIRVLGKREKTRLIPLPSGTVPWLARYLEEARPLLAKKPVANLFLGDRGGPLLRQTAYDLMEKYSKLAGLTGVSPHTLRHTYAVHLLKGGADLRAVQELLGHESIATTQIYTALDIEEVRSKYRQAHPRG